MFVGKNTAYARAMRTHTQRNANTGHTTLSVAMLLNAVIKHRQAVRVRCDTTRG